MDLPATAAEDESDLMMGDEKDGDPVGAATAALTDVSRSEVSGCFTGQATTAEVVDRAMSISWNFILFLKRV